METEIHIVCPNRHRQLALEVLQEAALHLECPLHIFMSVALSFVADPANEARMIAESITKFRRAEGKLPFKEARVFALVVRRVARQVAELERQDNARDPRMN